MNEYMRGDRVRTRNNNDLLTTQRGYVWVYMSKTPANNTLVQLVTSVSYADLYGIV